MYGNTINLFEFLQSSQTKLITVTKKNVVHIDKNSSVISLDGIDDRRPIQPYGTVHHDEYFDYSHRM